MILNNNMYSKINTCSINKLDYNIKQVGIKETEDKVALDTA